jgi:hypothetical protein
VATIATTAASIFGTIQSTKQATAQAKAQQAYYNKLSAEEAATEAEETRITTETQDRTRAYAASLINSDTLLNNNLSGSYDDENTTMGSGSIIKSDSLQGLSVQSMFA